MGLVAERDEANHCCRASRWNRCATGQPSTLPIRAAVPGNTVTCPDPPGRCAQRGSSVMQQVGIVWILVQMAAWYLDGIARHTSGSMPQSRLGRLGSTTSLAFRGSKAG